MRSLVPVLALYSIMTPLGVALGIMVLHTVPAQELALAESLLQAGQVRLRPILMTAFSTVFGMIPIALATSDGAELRTSMGIIVIGGLISSTFLTLFVVPAVYTLLTDAKMLSSRLVGAER